jgi:hypothetical protein
MTTFTLTNIILFFILVCLYFISNILWEMYNKDKIQDNLFFKNFGVSMIYCFVAILVVNFIFTYFSK